MSIHCRIFLSADCATLNRSLPGIDGAINANVKNGFFGSIDLSQVAGGGGPLAAATYASGADHHAGERIFSAPGISLTIRDPACDIRVDEGILAMVRGAPRFHTDVIRSVAQSEGFAAACLALYRKYGENAVEHATGHFSAVIIDRKNPKVLVATDRFSVWPICYASQGPRLHLSNRADTVPIPNERKLDPQAVFDYFYFHAIPAPRTVFERVLRLEAGHALILSLNGVRTFRYWMPRFEHSRPASFATLCEEFRSVIREAVLQEAMSGKVGCFLSGGTDSSTVTGLLGEVTGAPARTYSIGFNAEGYDEMEYARIAARHFRSDHHEYYLQAHDIVDGLPALAACFDQPFGNSSALPAFYCAKLAHQDGLDKLLGGDGGDELFGGNTRYARQGVLQQYHRLPATLRTRLVEPLLTRSRLTSLPFVRKAASFVEQARLPMPDRLETYNLLTRLGVQDVLAPDFLALVRAEDPIGQQRNVYHRNSAPALIDQMLAFDWKYTLADNDLVKVVGATSLAGIAVGFPLLANEVVDFSLRLTPAMKLKGLRLRYFFKEALRGFLPDEIILKKKHGFGLPFGPWLIQHEGLQTMVRDCLQSLSIRGIVRDGFLTELFPAKVQAHPGYYGEMVWVLVALEQWLSAHAPGYRVC